MRQPGKAEASLGDEMTSMCAHPPGAQSWRGGAAPPTHTMASVNHLVQLPLSRVTPSGHCSGPRPGVSQR